MLRTIFRTVSLTTVIVFPFRGCADSVASAGGGAPPSAWTDQWKQADLQFQKHSNGDRFRVIDSDGKVLAEGESGECLAALAGHFGKRITAKLKNLNVPAPTLGGKQFWGDEFYERGWKIQRNAITGHHRLLDQGLTRRAWGSYKHCMSEFRRLGPQPNDDSGNAGKLVIFLHGILRSSASFSKLAESLRNEGCEVYSVAYPSTRATIPEHAEQLVRILRKIENVEEIYFVCHSLGGLVTRAALQEFPDSRVKGAVTLGTPHKGAVEANIVQNWFPYRMIFGPAGQQLTAGEDSYPSTLRPPAFPMLCVAGGKSDGKGFSPLIPGDDDGVVGTASALPEFAEGTLVVDCLHSFLMYEQDAVKATIQFIGAGTVPEKQ